MKGKLGWALLVLTLSLAIAAGAQAKITSIRLKYVSASLRAGKSAVMPYTVKPSADKGNVTWSSSNESVATVSRAGRVTAIKAGTATITARASDGSAISSSCKLTVKPPAITKVTLNKTSITANASDESVALSASVTPAVAGVGGLKWTSSNKKVATVSSAGVVSFVGKGTCVITAAAPSGKKAACRVQVASSSANATRRALVIGEGRADTVRGLEALPMAADEVGDISQMFKENGIRVTSILNQSRAKVLSSIESAFLGANANDVSYVYISCHGGMVGGSYRLYPCGDGYITPAQLRQALDKVAGKVVLMLASCYSGTVINKGDEAGGSEAFLNAFLGAKSKSGEFKAGKYYVLCASRGNEKGYGVVTRDAQSLEIVRSLTYNFFGKAVTEGGSGKADANRDDKTTLNELYAYTHQRVRSLYAQWQSTIGLSASGTQTVTCYPSASEFVLF